MRCMREKKGEVKTGHLLPQALKSDKMHFHFSVPDKSHKNPCAVLNHGVLQATSESLNTWKLWPSDMVEVIHI